MSRINLNKYNTLPQQVEENKENIAQIRDMLIRGAGVWTDSVHYLTGDAVNYGKCTYIALSDNIAVQPDSNPDIWFLFSSNELWVEMQVNSISSDSMGYRINIDNIAGAIIRITYETCEVVSGIADITGSIVSQSITRSSSESYMRIPTNSVVVSGVLYGYFLVANEWVRLVYGIEIESEDNRPKILKIERLIENERS